MFAEIHGRFGEREPRASGDVNLMIPVRLRRTVYVISAHGDFHRVRGIAQENSITPDSHVLRISGIRSVSIWNQGVRCSLCETSSASPQAALRGMAAMACGLRYDENNRLLPLEGAAA
jgi:hypothetical protein